MPQLQFIHRVDGVRDGVLLVLPSVVHRDRYPQCFPLAGCVLQYIDKVVDVGDAVALWRLVKKITYFLRVARAVRLESGHYFLERLVLAATCPCALRQSTVDFGRISSFLYVKSGLGSSCSSQMEIWNYFYEQYVAVSACVSQRFFLEQFQFFSSCLLSRLPCAVRT